MEKFYVDRELLISLIKDKPVLWDRTTDCYKNRIFTIDAWKDIATNINPEFESMNKKARMDFGK